MHDHHHDALGSAFLATHATTHADASQCVQWAQQAAAAANTPEAWRAYQDARDAVVRRSGAITTTGRTA